MKILNLYAGIGGNRKAWGDEHEVTAVEHNPEIAKIYQDFFPKDKVIVGDAKKYLIKHYREFDFIWSSPPCQTHSRIRAMAVKHGDYEAVLPDMSLYSEISFLKHHFKGKWVVENVVGYYEPLLKPQKCGKHYFWCNFIIDDLDFGGREHRSSESILMKRKGFDISKYPLDNTRRVQVLRNCVEEELSAYIFKCAFKEQQVTL